MNNILQSLGRYKKIFGIFALLMVICGFTAFQDPDAFLSTDNLKNTLRWTALYGIISIGVSFVIMTAGIDLSIGSVIGIIGCILAMFMATTYTSQDALPVVSVDQQAQTLSIEGDASVYQSGDQLSFLNQRMTVASVSGSTITVNETPKSAASDGTLLRSHPVLSLADVDKTEIRRGAQRMHSRSAVIAGDQTAYGTEDQIQLLFEVGIPQTFFIHESSFDGTNTTVRFLIRQKQRVRKPAVALLSARSQRLPTGLAIALVLLISLTIGLTHGLLITKVPLQPFVVTLCGLLFYRGLARYLTSDQEQGFANEYPDLKEMAKGGLFENITGTGHVFDIPMPFVYMTLIGIVAAIFLNRTIYGRYILALGRNEEAARYSGINTDRMTILAYMICSFCAGIAGILFALDLNSVQPSSHGEFYELYAIAAAVLGGCSLRGGEGSILGVVIAAAVIQVLKNAINLIDGIDTSTEFAIIGMVILLGVITDELVKRFAARRRAILQARQAEAG